MALSDVQGQPRAVHALQAALSHGAVHHAWLLTGPSGVGKELATLGMAQALVCPVAPGIGCGSARHAPGWPTSITRTSSG